MRPKGRVRFSFTNVFATVALFAALSGTSYAAIKVTGKQIKNNSIASTDVKNFSVGRGDLAKGILESTKATPLNSMAYQAERDAGPAGVAASADYTPVATLQVPPGAYVILAKADLQADEVSASHCQLQAGSLLDVSARGLRSNSTPEAQNMQVAYTFPGPGTITLSCKASDGTWTASDSKILAVKVDAETG
jgi:hypothetical protein